MIKSLRNITPKIPESAFVAENAAVLGDVVIGEKSSVWYNVTLRGDVAPIRIGAESNIQDGSVLHGTYSKAGKNVGVTIHDRVTVGHLVMLHGCEIGSGCLIGMNSTVMDEVKIGEDSLVGAGSLVTEGKTFPPRSLILGRPAKWVRTLTDSEVKALQESADNYLLYSTWHR
jgi:carbonic anhydrase/acetyltransferase-like protein (isoleucine patch superfamily)